MEAQQGNKELEEWGTELRITAIIICEWKGMRKSKVGRYKRLYSNHPLHWILCRKLWGKVLEKRRYLNIQSPRTC